jgi:two-component system sensor histidine kinase RegB
VNTSSDDEPADDATGLANMQQLVQLRWIAVVGQIITICGVHFLFRIHLPIEQMLIVLICLSLFNILGMLRRHLHHRVSNGELFFALIVDVATLTVQLYLSGGATNPFIFLYLLQVILGAVLLRAWAVWAMVALTGACFIGLTLAYRPLPLPLYASGVLSQSYMAGLLMCFALNAALLVIFITRINRNLRARDTRLAALRERAVEEKLIVRMGLLATGAAHELGTPLSTMSVILGDWRHMPLLAAFIDGLVNDWRAMHPGGEFSYVNHFGADMAIVSDSAIQQMIYNVLDNAFEASPHWVGLDVTRNGAILKLVVTDKGQGFAPLMLAQLGKPYHSSKGRPGAGLGLFLVANVARTLRGSVAARNLAAGGAAVTITLPLKSLELERQLVHGT